MANKVIYAVYEDPEQLKDGARKLVSNGIKVKDVFSPFPVHGIDPIIGIKRTRWPSWPSCSASSACAWRHGDLVLQHLRLADEHRW
jgi:hypothetical protein